MKRALRDFSKAPRRRLPPQVNRRPHSCGARDAKCGRFSRDPCGNTESLLRRAAGVFFESIALTARGGLRVVFWLRCRGSLEVGPYLGF